MSDLAEANIGDLPTLYASYSVIFGRDLRISDNDAEPKRLGFRTHGTPFANEPVVLMFNLRNTTRARLQFTLNGVNRSLDYPAADSERAIHVVFERAIGTNRNSLILQSDEGLAVIGGLVAMYQVT